MSDQDDSMMQFIATVMARIYGLQKEGGDFVDALNLAALGGSRSAKATLANPWSSSVSASRRVLELETQMDSLREKLAQVGPGFLGIVLELQRLEKQREYHLEKSLPSQQPTTEGACAFEEEYVRLLNMLRDAGRISTRDAGRVSEAKVIQAARLIKRQTRTDGAIAS